MGHLRTSVLPWNNIVSWPGPLEKPKVATACADLSSYATRRLFSPSWPIDFMNHLLDSIPLVSDCLFEMCIDAFLSSTAVHVYMRKEEQAGIRTREEQLKHTYRDQVGRRGH